MSGDRCGCGELWTRHDSRGRCPPPMFARPAVTMAHDRVEIGQIWRHETLAGEWTVKAPDPREPVGENWIMRGDDGRERYMYRCHREDGEWRRVKPRTGKAPQL